MKKHLTLLVILVLALAMVISLSGCGQEQSTAGTEGAAAEGAETEGTAAQTFEIVIAASSEPETLDPQYSSAASGGNVNYNIYDYLVRMSADGTTVEPSLATAWEPSADGLTWTFHLREGVKFSNGEDFTADDVAYTLDRMFEPDTGRTTYNLGVISSWEVVDDYTINLVTNDTCNNLDARLYDMAIMPHEYAEEVGPDEFGNKPVGCGPYKVTEWVANDHITLESNEYYWGESPACTKITIRNIPEISTRLAELLAGTVDIVLDLNPDYIETLNASEGYSAVTALSKRVAYIGIDALNADSPVELQDVRVRQAMNYAIDRDAIIDSVYGSYANKLATIWREDYPGYAEALSGGGNAYPYDTEKAKQLLAEAGYPDGFNLDFYYSPTIFLKSDETALAVAGYLEDVGIHCNMIEMEYNAFRAVFINGQDTHEGKGIYTWNWGSKPQIPDGHLAGAVETGGITSYYSNPDVDALIDEIRYIQDENELNDACAQLQSLLYEDCPYIFLWQQVDIYGLSDRIAWNPRLDQYVLGCDMSLAQ